MDDELAVEAEQEVALPACGSEASRNADEAKPRGYILNQCPVWREQAALVHGEWLATVEYDPGVDPGHTVRLFLHVLTSGSGAVKDCDGFVPVSARLIEATFGVHRTERVWRPLDAAGLIDVREARHTDGLSREFRVKPELRDAFLRAAPALAVAVGDGDRYDLFANRPTRARGDRQLRTDSDGEPLPALVLAAIDEIRGTGCLFDLDAAVAYVDGLEREYESARAAYEAAGRPQVGPVALAVGKARARWQNDRYCLDQIRHGGIEHVGGPVYRYCPRFKRDVQSAGRITEIGGFQGASRGLKHAALAGLRATHDVRNYDLVSSQLWGLVQLFEEAGVDATWFRAYLGGDKGDYAERAFGSRDAAVVDLWKRCLLALVMSARMPETLADPARRRVGGRWVTPKLPDIARYVRDAFGGGEPTPEAEAMLASFGEVVAPFLAARDAWHDHLEHVLVERDGRWGRGGRYVRNAAGMTLRVDELTGWELRSRLAAHLLQGLEAAFIHRLTALAPVYGFSVASNQHDGLVTVGAIPEAAVAQARAESGLRYAELKEKPYDPTQPHPTGR